MSAHPRTSIMPRFLRIGICVLVLFAGCAAYDGRGLVPGTSTVAEVEALMGPPTERFAKPDGGSVLFYPKGPFGRQTFAVTLGADGVLRGIEQVLTHANAMKLVVGVTTAQQVRELFGPPSWVSHFPRQERHVWEYKWKDVEDKRVFWMQFSYDGILREAINMHDFDSDPPGGRARSRG